MLVGPKSAHYVQGLFDRLCMRYNAYVEFCGGVIGKFSHWMSLVLLGCGLRELHAGPSTEDKSSHVCMCAVVHCSDFHETSLISLFCTGHGACAAVHGSNQLQPLSNDTRLLSLLTDCQEEGQGNDVLFVVLRQIVSVCCALRWIVFLHVIGVKFLWNMLVRKCTYHSCICCYVLLLPRKSGLSVSGPSSLLSSAPRKRTSRARWRGFWMECYWNIFCVFTLWTVSCSCCHCIVSHFMVQKADWLVFVPASLHRFKAPLQQACSLKLIVRDSEC